MDLEEAQWEEEREELSFRLQIFSDRAGVWGEKQNYRQKPVKYFTPNAYTSQLSRAFYAALEAQQSTGVGSEGGSSGIDIRNLSLYTAEMSFFAPNSDLRVQFNDLQEGIYKIVVAHALRDEDIQRQVCFSFHHMSFSSVWLNFITLVYYTLYSILRHYF